MSSKWGSSLESTPDRGSRYMLIDARRVFVGNRSTCNLPSRWPCFSRLIHPGRLEPGGLMVEAVSKAFGVWWCHTLWGTFSGFPLDSFSGDGIVSIAIIYQGEEQMQEDDLRCS